MLYQNNNGILIMVDSKIISAKDKYQLVFNNYQKLTDQLLNTNKFYVAILSSLLAGILLFCTSNTVAITNIIKYEIFDLVLFQIIWILAFVLIFWFNETYNIKKHIEEHEDVLNNKKSNIEFKNSKCIITYIFPLFIAIFLIASSFNISKIVDVIYVRSVLTTQEFPIDAINDELDKLKLDCEKIKSILDSNDKDKYNEIKVLYINLEKGNDKLFNLINSNIKTYKNYTNIKPEELKELHDKLDQYNKSLNNIEKNVK